MHYATLVSYPFEKLIGMLYAAAGLELTAAVRQRMKLRLAEHPQHQGGKHTYSLSDYGLNRSSSRICLPPISSISERSVMTTPPEPAGAYAEFVAVAGQGLVRHFSRHGPIGMVIDDADGPTLSGRPPRGSDAARQLLSVALFVHLPVGALPGWWTGQRP